MQKCTCAQRLVKQFTKLYSKFRRATGRQLRPRNPKKLKNAHYSGYRGRQPYVSDAVPGTVHGRGLGVRKQVRWLPSTRPKSGDKAELISRRGRLLARAFPEVIQAIATLPHDAVLDAELVVSDERRHPAWDRLRRRSVMSRALRI